MKLAGSHGSVAIVPRWNSRATLPGLLSPGDHTSGWTTNTLHSHLAWRYWFRWGCGASSTTSVIADLAGGHISYPRSTGPDHAALHPLRHDAPDPSRCTRSEGVQCLRIGCTAAHNKPNRGHSLPTHPNRQHRTPPHGLDMLTPIPRKSRCTRYVAMHPIRRGVMPTDRVHRYPQQVSAWRYASTPGRNTRQGSSTAIEETVHNRETHASDEAADSSTHQLLGHSTTRTICACQPLRSLRGDKRTISNLLRHTSSHGR